VIMEKHHPRLWYPSFDGYKHKFIVDQHLQPLKLATALE